MGVTNNVGLITSDDPYGQTFYDWFGFMATERDYEAPFVCVLDDETTVADAVRTHYDAFKNGTFVNRIFFAPSDAKELIKAKEEIDWMVAYNKENNDGYYVPPTLVCADACVSEEVAQTLKNGYEGVEPTANPASGFIAAYEGRFGEHPRRGEAQLFDAVYLVYYSLKAMLVDGHEIVENTTDAYGTSRRHSPLWEYFIQIVDYDKDYAYGWFDYDVHFVLKH